MSRLVTIALGVGVLCAPTIVKADETAAGKDEKNRFVVTVVIPSDKAQKNARILTDQLARHPEKLGVRGALEPSDRTQDEVIRMAGPAGAGLGGSVDAIVQGSAKVVAREILRHVKGDSPIKGEFELRPTGKGTMELTIITTWKETPTTVESTIMTYEFEVKKSAVGVCP